VRKALVLVAVAAALAAPAAAWTAVAPGAPSVVCGGPCDSGGGSGWTGCTQQTASESGGIPWLAYYRHYLVVSYCKQNGIITSLGLAAHGCDWSGTALCNTGPAWLTSGGVGYGWASYTGHAVYVGALAGVPFAGTTVVDLSIPLG
jgi:hypothetical protein